MERSRKMTLTLTSKTQVRQQIDQMLEADYDALRAAPSPDVLASHTARNNPLIQQYIHVVQLDYHLPNPLVSSSSKRKIELSLARPRSSLNVELTPTHAHPRQPTPEAKLGRKTDETATPERPAWLQRQSLRSMNQISSKSKPKLSEDDSHPSIATSSKQSHPQLATPEKLKAETTTLRGTVKREQRQGEDCKQTMLV